MALVKLKDKMGKIKEEIDDAEEREQNAMSLLKEQEAKWESCQNEVKGTQRRITLLEKELEKVVGRLEEQDAKHKKVSTGNEANENEIKLLVEVEDEGEDIIQNLLESITEAEKKNEEATHLRSEADRKLRVICRELHSAQSREDVATERVQELEETLKNLGEKTKDLEEADEEANEREQTTEEKLKFLEAQVKEVNIRADDAERQSVTMQRTSDTILTEKQQWDAKKAELQDEMDSITEIGEDEDI